VVEEEFAFLVLDTVVVLEIRLGSWFILSAKSAFGRFQLANGSVYSGLDPRTRAFDIERIFSRIDSHMTVFN